MGHFLEVPSGCLFAPRPLGRFAGRWDEGASSPGSAVSGSGSSPSRTRFVKVVGVGCVGITPELSTGGSAETSVAGSEFVVTLIKIGADRTARYVCRVPGCEN